MKIWGVVGWKNAGKTTLVERLVAELVDRGISVSTIKHAHHAISVDRDGTDSDRHRRAGASEVLVGAAGRWALIHQMDQDFETADATLDFMLSRLWPVDLVIVEGFKAASIPKIEVWPEDLTETASVSSDSPDVRAFAGRGPAASDLPIFSRDDIKGIADFILAETGLA